MAELEKTPNLGIPRILGDKPFVRQQFNGALDELDKQALSVKHQDTKAHFELWRPSTAYKKQDIVRTPTCPSWGFYICIVAGTSGITEPQGYGEGDEITDGTCTWKLKLFGGATSINHGDLKFRNQPDQHSIEAITGLSDALDGKIDKVEGKELSSNDYIDTDKEKIDFISVTENVDLDILKQDSHTHVNKDVLDKLSDSDGKLSYDGNVITGGASDWISGKNYTANELVVYSNQLYRCNTNHPSTDFSSDLSYWDALYAEGSGLVEWVQNKPYKVADVVIYNKLFFRCITNHTSGTAFDMTKWELLGGNGIADMNYNQTTNTLDVSLTDGTSQSFQGLGVNYLGGFSQDVLWEGKQSAVGTITLNDDIENYDLIILITRLKTTLLSVKDNTFWINSATSGGGFASCLGGHLEKNILYVETFTQITSANDYIYKVIGIKGKINNAGEPSFMKEDIVWEGEYNYTVLDEAKTIVVSGLELSKYNHIRVHGRWYNSTGGGRNQNCDIYRTNTTYSLTCSENINATINVSVDFIDGNVSLSYLATNGMWRFRLCNVIGVYYKEGSSAIAPDWATGKDYLQNQLVVNLGTLYRCKENHVSTDFVSDKAYWEELSGGGSNGNGGGDIENVLWEGTAGSTDATVVNSLINLSESAENYELLAIEFIAYSLANSAVRRPQRREFSVSQLKDLINTPSSINYGLQSVWGYANYDDFVEISNLNGKTTLLSLDLKCKQAQITKVIGIKNSSLQIKDWESDKSYVQNQVVLNNDVMYRCIESHLSAESFDSTKWQELNRGTGIEDISYSLTNNTLTVKLTDGTAQSFSGLGINYFGGFNQTTLWKGDQAIPDSTMTTITLSDIFTNYDFIIVKCALGFAATAVVPVVDSGIGGGLSLYATSGANAFCAFSSGVSTNKKTLGFNTGKYVGWGQPRVLEVIGIKGSTTEKVLWEGNLGTTGLTNITGNITLTESLKNYSKVAFIINTYYSSSGNTYITPKKEELYVSELEPMISDTWNRATACWGFSTVTNCFYIKPTNAEMTEMWWAASQTKIIRIIGIK